MQVKHLRLVALAAAAIAVALVWALPALAQKSSAKATTVTVTEGKPSEFGITLSKKSVPHGAITFKVTNKGNLPHNFKLCSANTGGTANACAGKVTKDIAAGASTTLTVTVAKAGKYEYLCAVPGHAAGGMKGVLTVT